MSTYTDMNSVQGDERIDTRDLIELRDDLRSDYAEQDSETRADSETLIAAIDELESAGIEDFEHGASMIRADTFEDYAIELADDVGALPQGLDWPLTCIDWEQAARELAMDYTTVTFLGYDYYVR